MTCATCDRRVATSTEWDETPGGERPDLCWADPDCRGYPVDWKARYDAVRSLPVLPTCGQCADCYPPSYMTREDRRPAACQHPDGVGEVNRHAAPPLDCPLRHKETP